MPRPATRQNDRLRAEKMLRNVKRAYLTVVVAYAYEILEMDPVFWAAGYVSLRVLIDMAALTAAASAGIGVAHYSGWSQTLKDPSLFLVQQACAIVLALALAVAAPQIAFQSLAALFAASAYGFMAPSRRSLFLCWGLALIGAGAAIFIAGPNFAMPTGTFAGRVLTWIVMFGALARCIGLASFVSHLRRRLGEKNKALNDALERIEILAHMDELTGLSNRRSMMRRLDEQVALCDRTALPLCVALLDIDHFKRINDEFGHPIGDRVLQIFAERVCGTIRGTDRVGRYGGEEFLVLLMATTLAEAEDPLQRIRTRCETCDWSDIDPRLKVSLTIGATAYRHGEAVEDLIKRADAALYLGKEAGRNRVAIDDRILESVTENPRAHTGSNPLRAGSFKPDAESMLDGRIR